MHSAYGERRVSERQSRELTAWRELRHGGTKLESVSALECRDGTSSRKRELEFGG